MENNKLIEIDNYNIQYSVDADPTYNMESDPMTQIYIATMITDGHTGGDFISGTDDENEKSDDGIIWGQWEIVPMTGQ